MQKTMQKTMLLMLMMLMMMDSNQLMMMGEKKEKKEEKDMLREKSNNPNLKGGEQLHWIIKTFYKRMKAIVVKGLHRDS